MRKYKLIYSVADSIGAEKFKILGTNLECTGASNVFSDAEAFLDAQRQELLPGNTIEMISLTRTDL